MGSFKAIVIEKTDAGQSVGLRDFDEAQLMDGDVTVRVNGRPQLQGWPGADRQGSGGPPLADDPWHRFRRHRRDLVASGLEAGRRVILNGWGCGETHLGGYGAKARVKGDWLVRQPEGMSARDAMAIGTAGYTAMLAVLALERYGLTPAHGPVVVTGAAGGVGSVAVAILSKLGFQVTAVTGRPAEADYLRHLGASEILERKDLAGTPRPLAKERWAGGVDSVGSTTLANVLSMTRYGGAVAACGLAGGMDLPTSVAPFILRGVSLLGINSVMHPKAGRERAWQRLNVDLDRQKLNAITSEISLEEVIGAGRKIVDGQVRGRVVLRVD